MKHEIPDIIRKNCFDCFKSLNEAERAVVLLGEDQCIPTIDYIVWKLERREKIARGEIIE